MNAKQLAQIVATVSALMNDKAPKGASKAKGRKVQSDARMTKEEFEIALVAACTKAGYKAPEPRFNILTYDKWTEKGRKVRRGEKGIKVAGRKTRLFHEDQTDLIVPVQAPVAETNVLPLQ